ncbi:hypothetical protein [Mannheimia indoligenes]|uniref:hypothetical protein n=1 Tax=Mannheimia indoligenes TaxID=3103145 RepID=UPI002FE6B68E
MEGRNLKDCLIDVYALIKDSKEQSLIFNNAVKTRLETRFSSLGWNSESVIKETILIFGINNDLKEREKPSSDFVEIDKNIGRKYINICIVFNSFILENFSKNVLSTDEWFDLLKKSKNIFDFI